MNDCTRLSGTDPSSVNPDGKKIWMNAAERVALVRYAELLRPEDERLFTDRYVINFISPYLLSRSKDDPAWFRNVMDQYDQMYPGIRNSVIARIRYFDDCVSDAIKSETEQIVLYGSGYDTRACRVGGITRNVITYEIDRQEILDNKKEIIFRIFGELPDTIRYIPGDLETDNPEENLIAGGYDPNKKTIHILEGLTMYLRPDIIDRILLYIHDNTGEGSLLLFDYYPKSLVDGTTGDPIAIRIRDRMNVAGEPALFGIPDDKLAEFLMERGFSLIRETGSKEIKQMYFSEEPDLYVSDILRFAYAGIPYRKNGKIIPEG